LAAGSIPIREWLVEELAASLAKAFEAMVGARPEVNAEAGSPPAPGALLRRQKFQGLAGGLWIAAGETDWVAAGNEVLRAAGIEDGDQATLRSTYLETVGQALSSLASSITGRVGSEVTCGPAEDSLSSTPELSWSLLRLSFSSIKVLLELAFEPALLDEMGGQLSTKDAGAEPQKDATEAPEPASKTFDLLLDVELPVSVSFGRAQVALKDLIKLTTGSIVELNRSIAEPVEVIVNNCVIARGEVVVVEGNFGVRIQQVVSRQERLRTLV
jgi:flagellar motor switch protein FliN/FliY